MRRSRGKVLLFGAALAATVLLAVPGAEAARVEEHDAPRETVFSLIRKGGPVMIPLGIGSVIALALAIERFISLRRDRIIPPGFMEALKQMQADGTLADKGTAYCEEVDGPVGSIFKAGLARIDKGEEAVEKAIEDAGYREADKLKRSLRGLSVVANVSPLLGLLGTVYGMISAFQTASSVGMGKADVLAKGIYEALVTTAAGLTIAIPVLLVYQYLGSRVDAIVDDLDEMGIEFIAHCMPAPQGDVIRVARPLAD